MKPIIRISNLSKIYRLGSVGTGTLSHDLRRWLYRVRRKEDPYLKIETNQRDHKGQSDYVWGLKDINLDVMPGEVLGIIGSNGAGKSTLLKILSRVTGPTTGRIDYDGRIGALLEVGTGFHPELTGRENIFLNGAILGMTKTEIRSCLDAIIDFSGVERYIGTPVKRYSSGMKVRLGFAIAAHLEPEILVVDEVLAVGDAEFQKKAIGKMQQVSHAQGRTVLFVSHNMAAVKTLCSKALILNNGSISKYGIVDECVAEYLKGHGELTNHKVWTDNLEISNQDFELLEIGIHAVNKNFNEVMRIDEPLKFIVKFKKKNSKKRLDITLHLKDEQGEKLFATGTGIISHNYDNSEGSYISSVEFPANFFNWGNFSIDLWIVENRRRASQIVPDILSFTLVDKEIELGQWIGKTPGALKPMFEWKQRKFVSPQEIAK